MTISGNFGRFQYFKFEKNWSTVFLDESTKIENGTFPYKTVLSEAKDKTNRMGSTKWTYHKERSFHSNYFTVSKILFLLKNLA